MLSTTLHARRIVALLLTEEESRRKYQSPQYPLCDLRRLLRHYTCRKPYRRPDQGQAMFSRSRFLVFVEQDIEKDQISHHISYVRPSQGMHDCSPCPRHLMASASAFMSHTVARSCRTKIITKGPNFSPYPLL
jgi:hypothetical protein